MQSENNQVKQDWQVRQKYLGNTMRAVLFKNFPAILNRYIHRQHVKFILGELQGNYKEILDVGCGYGRISLELMKHRPDLSIEGVELVSGFVDHFSENVGLCYNGSMQDINLVKKYDAILLVTVLMYFEQKEILPVLNKLWENLKPGGRIICIEPVGNILISARKFFRVRKFEPTVANRVSYFLRSYLCETLAGLAGARVVSVRKIGLIPFGKFPELHTAISIRKM